MKWIIIIVIIAAYLFFTLPDDNSTLSPSEKPTDTDLSNPPSSTSTETVEPQTSQQSTVGLSEFIQEVPQSNELITRNYVWEFDGMEWSWEFPIPESLYEYFKELPRPPTKNYSVYITHPLDDTYIDLLVGKIREASSQQGYNEYETVEFAVTFVQSLPYTIDSVTTPYDEYPRYPIETLVDNGGDCEDTSILLASLLDKMGYGVVLIVFPDHIAVGVKGGENIYGTFWEYNGDKYYYLETTGTGWRIGQLPDVYEGTSAYVYPMVSTPILTHEWSIEARGNVGELKVTIYNLGSATANNVSVLAGFDAGEDKLWNGVQSETFNLGVSQQITVALTLEAPPLNKHTRLIVQIGIDDYLVDESFSEWFDT